MTDLGKRTPVSLRTCSSGWSWTKRLWCSKKGRTTFEGVSADLLWHPLGDVLGQQNHHHHVHVNHYQPHHQHFNPHPVASEFSSLSLMNIITFNCGSDFKWRVNREQLMSMNSWLSQAHHLGTTGAEGISKLRASSLPSSSVLDNQNHHHHVDVNHHQPHHQI